MMIINIHGFGGNKENSVYRRLKKKEIPDEEIYQLDHQNNASRYKNIASFEILKI